MSQNRRSRRIERSDAGKSILAGLLSLSAASWPWISKASSSRSAPGGMQSVLSSLLAMRVPWLPWSRRHPRRGEIKTEIMAALSHIDHYEDRDTRQPVDPGTPGARSVGLSFREIQQRVQAKYPGRGVSILTIRSYARDAAQGGQAMPYRRPNSARQPKTSG